MHMYLDSAFRKNEFLSAFTPCFTFHTHVLVVHTIFTFQADNENTKNSRENHLEDNANLHTKNNLCCA